MDDDERELVRSSVQQLLGEVKPAEVPAELLTAGWAEILEAEPAFAAAVLAEAQGRSLMATPSLDLVMLHAAGLPVDAVTAIVLPPVRRHAPWPGTVLHPGLRVDGLVLAGHERAVEFVVATDGGLVAVPAAELELQPVLGSDPELGLHRASASSARSREVASAEAWTAAAAAGRCFIAAELIGVAARMLDDTVAYVLARHQFGRPIASFQAVKHRLADVRVAVAAARAGLQTAYTDGESLSAIAAKCLAGRAHRLAATNCHQVHGGIAFTVEHGFHRFMRRGQVLDGLLGSSNDLTSELGRRILDDRRIPRTPQLRLEDAGW